MPTINQLSSLSSVSGGDLLPVYVPNNGDARKMSVSQLLAYFQTAFVSPTMAVNPYTPGDGFNITVPTPVSEQQWMLLQPAGALATGTITLPLDTVVPDGTEVTITTTQQIASLTIAPNGAAAIYGAATSLAAGSATTIRFYKSTNSWYNITSDTFGLSAAMLLWLANPSSANLAAAMTDETGTGLLVFNTSPTLTTPVLGTPASGTLTNCTGLPVGGILGLTATAAELNYTDGVTSAIQTQLDAKQAYDADIATVAASQAEMEAGTESALRSMSPLRVAQAIDALASGSAAYGLFRKADPTIAAWSKTGAFTVSTATTLYIEVNGTPHTIASSTAVTMPSATTGTDYAIWAKTDGTLEATSNHTTPPTANARKVGGFHYAPGGNATGTSGGDTTPAINAYSMWDLGFRPVCSDPRGMTLVAGGFWCDIYLTGVDAITNGSSKYNVTMADGSSPPKVPTMFGGNGSTTYGSYTWFEAMEMASAFGKRAPTQREFMAAMYGTTEASSVGSDQGSTVLNAAYTSKWGVIQATGVLWIWGDDRGGPYAGASWNANTEGRGSEYNAPNAVLLGGSWGAVSDSGSRCSLWDAAASASVNSRGSRLFCDHLQLD